MNHKWVREWLNFLLFFDRLPLLLFFFVSSLFFIFFFLSIFQPFYALFLTFASLLLTQYLMLLNFSIVLHIFRLQIYNKFRNNMSELNTLYCIILSCLHTHDVYMLPSCVCVWLYSTLLCSALLWYWYTLHSLFSIKYRQWMCTLIFNTSPIFLCLFLPDARFAVSSYLNLKCLIRLTKLFLVRCLCCCCFTSNWVVY